MNEESIQCIFDFGTGNQDGYENFQREQEEKNKKIRDIWKLPVGRNVCVSLHGVPSSFVGRLEVKEQPGVFNRREPLHLKIGRTGFYHNEIESCNIID